MSISSHSRKKGGRRVLWLALILCAAAVLGAAIGWHFYSQYLAASMRILRLEGSVHLQQNGTDRTLKDSVRLQSGDSVRTD